MKIIKNIFLTILFGLASFLNAYSMENPWKYFAQAVQHQEEEIYKENFLSAAHCNEPEQLQKLLKQNPKLINSTDDQGQTALHLAARHGNEKCIKILLDSGANVLATDDCGMTPLHTAAYKGQLGSVACLIVFSKVSPENLCSIKDEDDQTPYEAAKFGTKEDKETTNQKQDEYAQIKEILKNSQSSFVLARKYIISKFNTPILIYLRKRALGEKQANPLNLQ